MEKRNGLVKKNLQLGKKIYNFVTKLCGDIYKCVLSYRHKTKTDKEQERRNKTMNKKIMAIGLAAAMSVTAVGLMAGCGETGETGAFITTAISRTAGSGTRGAFDELVKGKDKDGTEKALEDMDLDQVWGFSVGTTGQVVTQVAGNASFLGYISLGSVAANTDRIKAVQVEGQDATVENVKSGNYELSRPFNLIYKESALQNELAMDFLAYMWSDDGLEILRQEYIDVEKPDFVESYTAGTVKSGSIYLHGSTSLQPLIEDLAEAYMAENPGTEITWGGGGSGEALASVNSDEAVFGMISRAAKGDELNLEVTQIAIDGIAVVVKKDSALTNVTFQQLFDLYAYGTQIECK